MIDVAFLESTIRTLLGGVPLTLSLTAGSVALGGVLAAFAAWGRLSGVAPADWLARLYIFVFRGTPLLVQIFLIYYGLGQFRPTLQAWGLWTFFREPYWCALLALALNTGAYTAEIFRVRCCRCPMAPWWRGGPAACRGSCCFAASPCRSPPARPCRPTATR